MHIIYTHIYDTFDQFEDTVFVKLCSEQEAIDFCCKANELRSKAWSETIRILHDWRLSYFWDRNLRVNVWRDTGVQMQRWEYDRDEKHYAKLIDQLYQPIVDMFPDYNHYKMTEDLKHKHVNL